LLHFQNLSARGNQRCFEPLYFGRNLRFIQFAFGRFLVIGMMQKDDSMGNSGRYPYSPQCDFLIAL
jgi:hypothetical protein